MDDENFEACAHSCIGDDGHFFGDGVGFGLGFWRWVLFESCKYHFGD